MFIDKEWLFFLLPIRKAGFKPFFKFRKSDFAVGAFVTLCHRLILPLFEIGLFDLPYTHTGGIALVILLIQPNPYRRPFLFRSLYLKKPLLPFSPKTVTNLLESGAKNYMKMERTRFEGSNTLKSAKSRSSFLKSGCSCGGCCGYGVCGGAGLRALGRGRCGTCCGYGVCGGAGLRTEAGGRFARVRGRAGAARRGEAHLHLLGKCIFTRNSSKNDPFFV